MKIAPIADAITAHNGTSSLKIEHRIVHTGQHYDKEMSELFFKELEIPEPDINLEVGSGSHAFQTAEIMKRFEPVLLEEKPDYVLVVGDVNSTIACALVAAKFGVKVIHVEAGLRSFDRSMPEEINRVLTDAISDLLFTTERSAEENLLREGISGEKIHFVGNVMIDTLLSHKEKARQSRILQKLGFLKDPTDLAKPYAVLTLHRPSNVDDGHVLGRIFDALNEISRSLPIVFPIHPRTRNKLEAEGISLSGDIKSIEPLGYLDFLKLMAHAKLVLTDSGGIQEETTVLGVPCLTLRENTERPVTITEGTNVLVGTDRDTIVHESLAALKNGRKESRIPELWDGSAAKRIVTILADYSNPALI
ncbi:MAG: UDP-N-acetylglucosamine 2-epimerase (non-hydrolyzing) [Thermodesulfobacteriota bacterium]|nr:UDP-N-acetylglucosamine 2-epimerase (non-hydrolyzing) [Thermodesulfobacteriota bacterium]